MALGPESTTSSIAVLHETAGTEQILDIRFLQTGECGEDRIEILRIATRKNHIAKALSILGSHATVL